MFGKTIHIETNKLHTKTIKALYGTHLHRILHKYQTDNYLAKMWATSIPMQRLKVVQYRCICS